MNKKIVLIVGVIIVVVIILILKPSSKQVLNMPISTPGDYKNISYEIDGQTIMLANGKAETDAEEGAVSKISTELYFGNEARADLNGDGKDDIVFLLFQNGGGTGVFYYVVVALSSGDVFKGTNAVLLGDRIAPQTTEIKNGQIIVNYADRKDDEPFTAQPSVGVSKYLKIVGQKLVEVK
jgi:hypothetical protein